MDLTPTKSFFFFESIVVSLVRKIEEFVCPLVLATIRFERGGIMRETLEVAHVRVWNSIPTIKVAHCEPFDIAAMETCIWTSAWLYTDIVADIVEHRPF